MADSCIKNKGEWGVANSSLMGSRKKSGGIQGMNRLGGL